MLSSIPAWMSGGCSCSPERCWLSRRGRTGSSRRCSSCKSTLRRRLLVLHSHYLHLSGVSPPMCEATLLFGKRRTRGGGGAPHIVRMHRLCSCSGTQRTQRASKRQGYARSPFCILAI